ncbi:MAG: tetratricopeptide repeat protein, partial [bacterium]
KGTKSLVLEEQAVAIDAQALWDIIVTLDRADLYTMPDQDSQALSTGRRSMKFAAIIHFVSYMRFKLAADAGKLKLSDKDKVLEEQKHLRATIQADPHYFFCYKLLAESLLQAGRFAEVRTLLEQALNLPAAVTPGERVTAHVYLYQAYWAMAGEAHARDKGNLPRLAKTAIDHGQEVLRLCCPDNQPVLKGELGDGYYKHHASIQMAMAIHDSLSGNLRGAETYYRAAIAAAEDNVHMLLYLVRHAEEDKNFDETLALEAALAADPACVPALASLARVKIEQDKHQEALSLYERLIAIEPLHFAGAPNYGICLVRVGRAEEAKQYFLHMLRVVDSGQEKNTRLLFLLHQNLGGAYHQLKDNVRATTYYRQALEIAKRAEGEDIDKEDVKQVYLGLINAAPSAAEASAVHREAITNCGEDKEFYYFAAYSYMEVKDHDKLLEMVRGIYKLDPNWTDLYDILEELGEFGGVAWEQTQNFLRSCRRDFGFLSPMNRAGWLLKNEAKYPVLAKYLRSLDKPVATEFLAQARGLSTGPSIFGTQQATPSWLANALAEKDKKAAAQQKNNKGPKRFKKKRV